MVGRHGVWTWARFGDDQLKRPHAISASSDVGLQPVMCWHRLNRLVHLSHELRKPIGGDEHVVDLRVVNPLDRSGLDALQDSTSRFRLRFNISNLEGLNQSQGARYGIRRAAPGAEVGRGFRPTPQPWAKAGL